MSTKQTIAVIGASGNMGSAISKSLSKGNNRLLLFANEKEKVNALVQEIKGSNSAADVDPALNFKSTSIKKAGKNTYKLTGDLTLHGVTKPVTMDLLYRGTTENPMSKKQTAGFQITGTIKRSDFNVGPGFPAPMISDEVKIKADGEFIQNDK